MPHIPDHLTHDPELVAAYAAGDATGSDLATATELVAACTECAELHRDLRAIATALPELPVPARTRDFRLTPTQAASLQPSGWRGVLAAFAAPRFRLAAPLGTGLAAAGLAGLLLASPGGLVPSGGATAGAAATADGGAPIANPVPEGAVMAAASEQPVAAASEPSDAQAAPSAAASQAAALAPDASAPASSNPDAIVPSPVPAIGTSGGSRNSTTQGTAASPADDAASQLEIKSSDHAYAAAPVATPITPAADNTPLAVLGLGLLVAGVLLIALRVGARLVA